MNIKSKLFLSLLLFSLLLPFSGFCQDSLQTAETAELELRIASIEFENGVYWAQGKDSLYSLVNSQGQVLTKMKYARVYPFYNGVAIVQNTLGALGLVNIQGKEIGRCIFQMAPEKFGVTHFIYRPGSEIISWMYQPNMRGVWLNQKGKILVSATKVAFTMEDVIPEKLWDY